MRVDKQFLATYLEFVRDEIEGRNCVIVASADVNPITEVVLACSYDRGWTLKSDFCFSPNSYHDSATVIAIKGPALPRGEANLNQKISHGGFNRRFYRTLEKMARQQGKPEQRGFLIDGKEMVLDYFSQDESEESFSILAHLVVVRNPFSPEENVIVVLNGVSGPATFGLAEVLTGGRDEFKAEASEQLLRVINRVWAEAMDNRRHLNGIEAILSVQVQAPDEDAGPKAQKQLSGTPPTEEGWAGSANLTLGIGNKIYDKRNVVGWKLYVPTHPIITGNPRPIPFVY